MNRIRQIIYGMAALLAVLLVGSCEQPLETDRTELVISLYIPDAVMTKGDTGPVAPLNAEKEIKTLQIWVFLHDEQTLVTYKRFDQNLSNTGLPNSTITRFSLPLSQLNFNKLLRTDATVDVYAVANLANTPVFLAPNKTEITLGEETTLAQLDSVVLAGGLFGPAGTPAVLSTAFPAAGLPMSGVLKDEKVSGGYPVLNVSTLSLTRAVSKIRFVFCQQANPSASLDPSMPTPFNEGCKIVRITFDGMNDNPAAAPQCGIADKEYLFTTERHAVNQELFHVSGYTPLAARVSGPDTLIPNRNLYCAEFPEVFIYQSPDFENESAQQYESRLDSIGAASQIGPIYLRETDKKISGIITYTIDNGATLVDKEFSLGTDDVLSRNHSWIVYAYFSEETKSLELTVNVQPWEWSKHAIDYTSGSVNVIRRFTVLETAPETFKKIKQSTVSTDKSLGFYDIKFWHTPTVRVEDRDSTIYHNTLKGEIIIATPVGATLRAVPVSNTNDCAIQICVLQNGDTLVSNEAIIYPNHSSVTEAGTIEDCKLTFFIRCDPAKEDGPLVSDQYIDLHFCVETQDGRIIDLGSESVDFYRFYLTPNWNTQ